MAWLSGDIGNNNGVSKGKMQMCKGHETLMGRALAAACRASLRDEVPVGAAMRLPSGDIFTAANRVMRRRDPTAHAAERFSER